MTLINKLLAIKDLKFSFGKNDEYFAMFNNSIGTYSMNDHGFGLGIPTNLSPENQLRAVFTTVNKENGVFIFNINGVDLIRASELFIDYDEADGNNMITEWELSVILQNNDYLERTIFHNGKIELNQIVNGIEIKWKSIKE